MKEDAIMDAIAIMDIVKWFIPDIKMTFSNFINIEKTNPAIPNKKKMIWKNDFNGCFFISIAIPVKFRQNS